MRPDGAVVFLEPSGVGAEVAQGPREKKASAHFIW